MSINNKNKIFNKKNYKKGPNSKSGFKKYSNKEKITRTFNGTFELAEEIS